MIWQNCQCRLDYRGSCGAFDKKLVFEQIEKFRKPGTLVTSNTSGIPIHFMSEGRSEDFQKTFAGTHFLTQRVT
jgi:hypothetical protein